MLALKAQRSPTYTSEDDFQVKTFIIIVIVSDCVIKFCGILKFERFGIQRDIYANSEAQLYKAL